ncbi:MAG: hypothetical protein ABI402_11760 [Ferruginibacter sp.]
MKKYKIIDTWISTILISIFALIYLVSLDFGYVITGYFIVGSWQLISMIVHAWNHWFTAKGSARIYYHWFVGVCLISIPISFEVLLYMAPFMAAYYTWICYEEVYIKMKRPLSILK